MSSTIIKKMEKNLEAVNNFQKRESFKFLRGMCFNNAATLLSSKLRDSNLDYDRVTTFRNISKATFELAKELFDEAKNKKFDEWEWEEQ